LESNRQCDDVSMNPGEIKNRRDFTAALDKTEDNAKQVLVIGAYTTWCPNCKAVQPKVNEIAREFGDKVLWYKYGRPGLAAALCYTLPNCAGTHGIAG
jgi:thiol-disulfide isomerase/thioredoxin